MKPTSRPLLVTFAVVSIVTIGLATLLARPASELRPLRSWSVDLDEPVPATPGR